MRGTDEADYEPRPGGPRRAVRRRRRKACSTSTALDDLGFEREHAVLELDDCAHALARAVERREAFARNHARRAGGKPRRVPRRRDPRRSDRRRRARSGAFVGHRVPELLEPDGRPAVPRLDSSTTISPKIRTRWPASRSSRASRRRPRGSAARPAIRRRAAARASRPRRATRSALRRRARRRRARDRRARSRSRAMRGRRAHDCRRRRARGPSR